MEYKIIDSRNFQNDQKFIVVTGDGDLEHHGVLGQKWGVRRYQNKDGSLTALGKRRASGADFDGDTVDEKGNVRPGSLLGRKSGDLQTAQNVLSNATNVAQKLNNITTRNAKSRTAEIRSNIDLSHVTDSDLKAMVNRLNMEKQYKDLTMEAKNTGKRTLSDTLATVGDVLAVGASAAAILVAINQIKKKS